MGKLFILSRIQFLFLFVLTLSACKKEPGEGGQANIMGRLYAFEVDKYGAVVDSGYIADERVFIKYGNNSYTSNDVRTSYGGYYAFEYLQTGDYVVYAVSKCDTCQLGQAIDSIHVTISKTRQDIVLRDLKINI